MSFDLQEVFSSVQSFLSSGYVLLLVLFFLVIGSIKKIFSLLLTGAVAFALWFFCQDQIVEAFYNILSFLKDFA